MSQGRGFVVGVDVAQLNLHRMESDDLDVTAIVWCGGWDLNPRTPAGQGPEPCAFDLAWQPPPGKHSLETSLIKPSRKTKDTSILLGSTNRTRRASQWKVDEDRSLGPTGFRSISLALDHRGALPQYNVRPSHSRDTPQRPSRNPAYQPRR